MDELAGRDGAVDGAQEAEEFLVTVVLNVAADHLDGGRPVAFIIVGHRSETPRLQRQAPVVAGPGFFR